VDYGEVFVRTWHIFWRNKILWLFAVVPAMAAVVFAVPMMVSSMQLTREPISGPAFALFWVFFILLMVTSLLAASFSYAAVIRGGWLADEGGERVWPLSFSRVMQNFGPAFGRSLVVMLVYMLIVLLVTLPMILPAIWMPMVGMDPNDTAGFTVLMLFMFCGMGLFIPITMVVYLYLLLVITAAAGENLPLGASFSKAWSLFRRNLGPLLLIGLMVFLLMSFLGTLISLPLSIIMIPLMFVPVAFGGGAMTGSLVALFTLFGLVAGVLTGIMYAYMFTLVSVVYRRLDARSIPETARAYA